MQLMLTLIVITPMLLGATALSPEAGDNRLSAAVEAVLADADELELISLSPRLQRKAAGPQFHGWRILGSMSIMEPKLRAEVVAELRRGIRGSDGSMAACFQPRTACGRAAGRRRSSLSYASSVSTCMPT